MYKKIYHCGARNEIYGTLNNKNLCIEGKCVLCGYHCTCKIFADTYQLAVCLCFHKIFQISITVVNWDGELHTWVGDFWEWYVKNKSHKRRFHHKYPGVWISASLMNFKLVKKVRVTGSFLAKKYTRQCCANQEKAWWNGNQIKAFVLQIPDMISSLGTYFDKSTVESGWKVAFTAV